MLLCEKLSSAICGAAIEVHRELGPGLLESTYEECRCHELRTRKTSFERQVGYPVKYKGVMLDCGYRADVVVEKKILLELKSVEAVLPIHESQLMTYLKLGGLKLGMLLNFNSVLMKDGIKRIVM